MKRPVRGVRVKNGEEKTHLRMKIYNAKNRNIMSVPRE